MSQEVKEQEIHASVEQGKLMAIDGRIIKVQQVDDRNSLYIEEYELGEEIKPSELVSLLNDDLQLKVVNGKVTEYEDMTN